MKINKTGNDHSELLNKMAQIIPEGISGGKPDFPRFPSVSKEKIPPLLPNKSVIIKLKNAIEMIENYDYDLALNEIKQAFNELDKANISDKHFDGA